LRHSDRVTSSITLDLLPPRRRAEIVSVDWAGLAPEEAKRLRALGIEEGARVVPEFLKAVLADYKIRDGKFHVAGPSNGGIAAFHVAAASPQYFLSVTAFPGYMWQPSAAKLQAGATLSATWPVYAQGTADVQAYVLPSSGPFKILYDQRPAYSAGGFVTDPLPEGYGYVELDYVQPMPGAFTRLQLISGPDVGLQPGADVEYLSWQGAGFTVIPEPTVLGPLALGLTLLGRPRRT